MQWLEQVGMGVVAAASLVANIWQWWNKSKVDKAADGAQVAIAESQGVVYAQMKERLSDLAAHVDRLTAKVDEMYIQIRERDDRIHAMELHIKDLEHTLRQHGIDPPTMRY